MLHVKPSAQTPTAAPHCGSHCHPAPRIFNTASSLLLQTLDIPTAHLGMIYFAFEFGYIFAFACVLKLAGG